MSHQQVAGRKRGNNHPESNFDEGVRASLVNYSTQKPAK